MNAEPSSTASRPSGKRVPHDAGRRVSSAFWSGASVRGRHGCSGIRRVLIRHCGLADSRYCPVSGVQQRAHVVSEDDGAAMTPLPPRTTRFVIRVGLTDDGTTNIADRLDAVARRAITAEFGTLETDVLVTIGLDPPNRFLRSVSPP